MAQAIDYDALAKQHGGVEVSAPDEQAFRQWYAGMAKQQGLSADPDDPQQFYDYRAAFKAGAKPDATGHWPSDFKKPGHPNMVVGGFNVQTGERVPGTKRATKDELIKLGWEPATAAKLAASPEPSNSQPDYDAIAADVAQPAAFNPPRFKARTWGDTAADLAGGVRAGVANTIYGGGDVIRRTLGMERVIERPEVKAAMTPPNSTPGKIGYTAEQIGEFFLPTGVTGKLGKAAEVLKSGVLTAAQTSGDPTATALSAGITAAIPVAGSVVSKLSGKLKESALETMAGSLKATKEWAKEESARLAPEMLKRGVGGSIPALRKLSTGMAAKVGKNLDDAYATAAQAGQTVPGLVIQGNVQLASDALHMRAASGKRLPIPGYETAIKKLAELDDFVGQMGPDIPVDKAAALKRAFDDIAEQAGLFGPNKMASASEKKQAWAFKQAANSFRQLLNTDPTIAALNKEASFWIGLRDVVNATKLRKIGQTGGLIAAGGSGVGAVMGAASGDSYSDSALKGLLGAAAGRQLVRVLQSPAYMNKVSAPLKNALAEALASGNPGQVRSVVGRIASSLPSELAQSLGR